jgi:hypothetical protein
MLLLIQRTCITWSKRSRGGPLAQARARVPTRASVPAPRAGGGWLLQRVSYAEGHGDATPFAAPRSWVEQDEALPPAGLHLGSDGLRMLAVGEDLEVHDTMGRSSLPAMPGRPDRPQRVGVVLRVPAGSWAGWVENQRHVDMDTGHWWYSETHWCFAWLPRHDPEIFIARAPARWLDHRAQLR